MKRKDLLAAGAAKATFVGGFGKTDALRNASDEKRDTSLDKVKLGPKAGKRKKFIPLAKVLLIRPATIETQSSVLVTESIEKEKPAEGDVLEAGPGCDVSVGDHVVFGKYSGTEFKLNGEVLLLMSQDEVQGTIVDAEV